MHTELISFSEALNKVKNKETTFLIRAKWLVADYINGIILLYDTEHISLEPSFIAYSPDVLTHWTGTINGTRTGTCAALESNDILSDDYIDISGWKIARHKEDYENLLKIIKENGV